MENATDNDGKTIGIIAYITLIGWVVAILMNSGGKNEYASFHIRQMLGLILLSLVISVLSIYVNLGLFGTILSVLVLVLWVIGFVGAIQGERKLVPIIGENFQEWFKGIK
ncbi:hypothetical protein [uncultured Planktosalinus sp.]|uniref:hypothetical protein n=1 Tax=uncultured Planktosalinus sp. TaxID=1810935 RepID=UPI0030D98A39